MKTLGMYNDILKTSITNYIKLLKFLEKNLAIIFLFCFSIVTFTKNTYAITSIENSVQYVASSYQGSEISTELGGHECALTTDGKMYCWGINYYGQLGTGENEADTTCTFGKGRNDFSKKTPTLVTGLEDKNINQIALGWYHTCALTDEGELYCFGSNSKGQLGVGDTSIRVSPTKLSSLNFVSKVALSQDFTCAITIFGKLYCWGYNRWGQVGNNTSGTASNENLNSTNVPGDPILSHVKDITLGNHHACAISVNGDVYCFGRNDYGQVGNGFGGIEGALVKVPVKINISNVNKLVSSNHTTCAITTSNDLYCWGYNLDGQVGNGSLGESYKVVIAPVKILSNVQDVSVGNFHTCAVTQGALKCWGLNTYGELGTGDTLQSATPKSVINLSSDVKNVYVNDTNTCATKTDGTLYCFGLNDFNQIDDTLVNKTQPVQIVGASNVKYVAMSYKHNLIVDSHGALYLQGYDKFRLNYTQAVTTPRKVDVTNVQKSYTNSMSNSTCAIKIDGTVSCWGYNNAIYGLLGMGGACSSNPVKVTVIRRYYTPKDLPLTKLDEGDFIIGASTTSTNSCYVTHTGKLFCAGSRGSYNMVGDGGAVGSVSRALSEATIVSSYHVVDVIMDEVSLCILDDNKDAYCWGYAANGRLGYGELDGEKCPVKEGGETVQRNCSVINAKKVDLSNIEQIAGGFSHRCAITSDNELYCWGYNAYGCLGRGNIGGEANSPVKVDHTSIVDAVKVSAGTDFTCIINSAQEVWCVGFGESGQLGNGANENSKDFVKVTGISGAVQIASSIDSTCALLNTGEVYCWGNNENGKLGNASTQNSNIPQKVTGLSNVRNIMVSKNHACAVTNDNLMYCWGSDSEAQIAPQALALSTVFDGSGEAPCFNTQCCEHWNFGRSKPCGLESACYAPNPAPVPICSGDTGRASVICDIEPASCCNDALYNFINTDCQSGGIGACNVTDKYTCGGSLYTSSVVCPAVEGEPQEEVCNGIDDDCNNVDDDGFNIGQNCETAQGKGEYECLNETQNYCKVLETYTPTNTFTNTFTNSPTQTLTATQTSTPTETLLVSLTPTNTSTVTNTATNTNTNLPTDTATNTPTNTSTNTATNTLTNTPTNLPTDTATNTPTNTSTNTATNTLTNTPTNLPTDTATNTPTNTSTNTATNTLTNTPTNLPTDTATNTPTNTSTNTATNTLTNTPTNTATSTNTQIPYVPPIVSDTMTFTATSTFTETSTSTPVYTNTYTRTPMATVTSTPVPSYIEVVYPNADVPMTNSTIIGSDKILITLPQVHEARFVKDDPKTKAKYKYLIHLRKLKRNGFKDVNYKLGRKLLRYSHRKTYSFRNLDKGVYSLRYLIIIEDNKKTGFTKWSARNLKEVK